MPLLPALALKATVGWLLSSSLLLVLTLPTAQAASCKAPKSYYKNVACTSMSGYFLASKDYGAPVALIDSKGKPVVDLSAYQKVAADKIAAGLIPVQRSGRIGYVNMQGQTIIPLIYDVLAESRGWARAASEGRIVVKKGGNYGVIDNSNQTIVPFSSAFSDIDNYSNGVAKARKNKVNIKLDSKGNTISEPSSTNANNANNTNNANGNNTKAGSAQASALAIDKPLASSTAVTSKTFTTLKADQQDGKWGFIDEQKTIMITYSFDEVRPFSEGLAGVRINNKWGFLNLGGELVIPFNFSNSEETQNAENASMFIFNQGKAWIGTLNNGAKICIGTQGNVVDCD
ncbi:WG repeat-containing protein [Psychrobacter urativorans]|uniref:WG repeat-containing protein n=1 Tax=Psychrobacter urativorans TaxID=45610 RepID=UPI003BB81102